MFSPTVGASMWNGNAIGRAPNGGAPGDRDANRGDVDRETVRFEFQRDDLIARRAGDDDQATSTSVQPGNIVQRASPSDDRSAVPVRAVHDGVPVDARRAGDVSVPG